MIEGVTVSRCAAAASWRARAALAALCVAGAGACGGSPGAGTGTGGQGGTGHAGTGVDGGAGTAAAAGAQGGAGRTGAGGASGTVGTGAGGTTGVAGAGAGGSGVTGPAAEFCNAFGAAFCKKVYACTPLAEQDGFFHALFGPNETQCAKAYAMLCAAPPSASMSFDVNCYGKSVDATAKAACLGGYDTVTCAAFNDPSYKDGCDKVCVVGGGTGSGGTGADGGAADAPADAGRGDGPSDAPVISDALRGNGAVPVGTATPDCINGWCWSNQLPQGEPLTVWASGANDAWAVGPLGQTRHFDGNDWKRVPSGTTDYLWAVWGSAANDVWAVGEAGVMAHWTGAAWSLPPRQTAKRLLTVWARAANDVWVGGEENTLLHYDGALWSPMSSGRWSSDGIRDITGTADGTVFLLAGTNGNVMRRRPGETSFSSVDVGNFVSDIWAAGPNDVWGTGYRGTFHFDGARWSPVDVGFTSDLFYVAVTGTGPGDVWLFGYPGVALHFNGMILEPWATGTTQLLGQAFARAAGDVWVTGWAGELRRFQPTGFQRYDHGVETYRFLGAWAAGPDDVWAAGDDGVIARYHAATGWQSVASGTKFQITAMWGSGPNDAWAVGQAGITVHWNGTAWAPVASGTLARLEGVWGSGPNDVWAVGENGTISRWNGTRWTTGPPTTVSWRGVWGSAADDVWLVGSSLTENVWRWNGTTYTKATVTGLNGGVLGRSRDEVYGWGNGQVFRWDGASWKDLRIPLPPSGFVAETSLGTGATGDLWVSANGSVTRWNGATWSPYEAVVGNGGFFHVLVTAADVWVFGQNANILRHAP